MRGLESLLMSASGHRNELMVDWARTARETGAQPLNPITRITSLFTEREVGVVATADDKEWIVAACVRRRNYLRGRRH